ncbi:cofilin [Mortierella claussenii]|nr:cofilin [Mortierella claussenii]
MESRGFDLLSQPPLFYSILYPPFAECFLTKKENVYLKSSASGVTADQTCLEAFQELKLRKKLKYIIYKLSDNNSEIVVEEKAETATYDEFLEKLPKDDCRWAVYDFDFSTPDGERNKIVFYSWSPDDAKIKSKMLYSSSKDALRKTLNGVAFEVQGTDRDEVEYETVLEKVQRR